MLVIIGLPACGGLLPTPSGETDAVPACNVMDGCNGVEVFCHNDNLDGADETGAGEDGNFWWRHPYPQVSCEGEDGEWFLVEGVGGCRYEAIPDVVQGAIGMCIGNGFPAPLDVLDPTGWQGDGYPAIDDEIRAECTAKCVQKQYNQNAGPQEVCQDANWSAVRTRTGWEPSDGFKCHVTGKPFGLDPDGGDVPWELAGGLSTPIH
jgi:hypothetical protein